MEPVDTGEEPELVPPSPLELRLAQAWEVLLKAWALLLKACRLAVFLLTPLWRLLSSRRLWRWLTAATVTALVLVAMRVLPALYGRMALAREAGDAARQCQMKGEDRVLRNLQRAAFTLGFTEATQARLFTLEKFQEDGVLYCSVSYDFTHRVNLYGLAHLALPVKAKVLRPTLDPLPTPTPDDPEP